MAKRKLTDTEAKRILRRWPRRTKSLWPAPGNKGYWLRAQPRDRKGTVKCPTLSSPGAILFKTQPDGLWVHFNDIEFCDIVVIEVCGTIQNLNDKRSRYIPASHSMVLRCGLDWLMGDITLQAGRRTARWTATRSIHKKPTSAEQTIPVRHLRALYALPNDLYGSWCPQHSPTGYEFYCPHSSLDSFNNPMMRRFLRQMSLASYFYTKL